MDATVRTDATPRLSFPQQMYNHADFTTPYDTATWETRDAIITDKDGKTVFEQRNVLFPTSWSQTATNVVASKYFRGPLHATDRERSVSDMITRVVQTITQWGIDDHYFSHEDGTTFANELTYLLLHQYGSFNSPVWFNVGIHEQPQCSACFILDVDDSMPAILEWYRQEGLIFQGGSGSGVNVSKIRGSNESLARGGKASGPLSFMRAADASAGAIKSGGVTRRAAKMIHMDIDHPDIMAFITCKHEEERKARALIAAGYDSGIDGDAYATVSFQNTNHSVVVSEAFLRAVEDDDLWILTARTTGLASETVKARALMRAIAVMTWECGDPGMFYEDTVNTWHTTPSRGPIRGSNPCSEFLRPPDEACNLASLNLLRFLDEGGRFDADSFCHAVNIFITAQEIMVSRASYPTSAIQKNSHAYRTLGLGYANLGAVLMAKGLPYDSEEGRAYAASITALMTGQAYLYSAEIARVVGAFSAFEWNREPMLNVIAKHHDALNKVERACDVDFPDIPMELLDYAWETAYRLGETYGYRNAQVSVLAPTGCLTKNSLIPTSNGLLRLKDIGNQEGEKWQEIDIDVMTDYDKQKASQFFINGVENVVSVETRRGFQIKGTPRHRIKVFDNGIAIWKRFAEIREEDVVPLQINTHHGECKKIKLPSFPGSYFREKDHTFSPDYMTKELAEFIGAFMANGSWHRKGLRFHISGSDHDVADRISELAWSLFGISSREERGDAMIVVSVHSTRLSSWWISCGFSKTKGTKPGKGLSCHIPYAILATNNREIYCSFIRGVFDHDGTVTNGMPSFSNKSRDFVLDMQVLMLHLGYPTSIKKDIGGKSQKPVYVIRLLNNSFVQSWSENIGFYGSRKSGLLCFEQSVYGKYDFIPFSHELLDEIIDVKHELRKDCIRHLRQNKGLPRDLAKKLLLVKSHKELSYRLQFFYDAIAKSELAEDEMTFDLSVPTNVTYIANGFISHNTISFMMDCSTTGIEPDTSLVSYKKLVGGGTIKHINTVVPRALDTLGYNGQAKEICQHIAEQGTIEGAPYISPAHLSVFDCAFPATQRGRAIGWEGHVRMVAAVQPFLSGGISKTINMPHDSTVEEIENAYMLGWRLGCKSMAIYRDGCKHTQPVTTHNTEAVTIATTPERVPQPIMRRRLPDERAAITHKATIGGHEFYVTVGLYDDGKPGEIFLHMAKEGSTISGLMDSFATAISISLQYGVPLEALIAKFSHMRFEPSGFTKNKEIPMAKSIMDYLFRWLASKFTVGEASTTPAPQAIISAEHETLDEDHYRTDAPICGECGSLMTINGSCYKCTNCGGTSGCS